MAAALRTVAQRHTTLRIVFCRITLYRIKKPRLRPRASTERVLPANPIHDAARGLTAVLGRGRVGWQSQCGVPRFANPTGNDLASAEAGTDFGDRVNTNRSGDPLTACPDGCQPSARQGRPRATRYRLGCSGSRRGCPAGSRGDCAGLWHDHPGCCASLARRPAAALDPLAVDPLLATISRGRGGLGTDLCQAARSAGGRVVPRLSPRRSVRWVS